ncbi:MAG: hypothetical protein ACYTBJ_00385 [Planctomycetota bacterium]|jgi:hypothetical protein
MNVQKLQEMISQILPEVVTELYAEIGPIEFYRTFLHHMREIPLKDLVHDESHLRSRMSKALASTDLNPDLSDPDQAEKKIRRVFGLLRAWARLGSPSVREKISGTLLVVSEAGRYAEPHKTALDLAHEIQRMGM